MLKLTAYMDETGHSSDQRQKYVGMAGLIAPESNWEEFERKWNAALKLTYINLEYFHMTDFAARQKAYKGWSEPKRRAVLGKIWRVIETSLAMPFGVIVPMELYRKLSDEHKQHFVDPYYIGFESSLAACTTFLEFMKITPEEKITMVFSEQVEFKNRAMQFYDLVKDFGIMGSRGTPPIFRDMRDVVPLQAADVVAYEMYKECERRQYRPTSEPRYGYKRLLKMTQRNRMKIPMLMFFDEKRFASHIDGYEETKKQLEQLERKK